MKRTATFFFIAILMAGVGLPQKAVAEVAASPPSTVVINELQTGGCTNEPLIPASPTTCAQEDGMREFIELYNPGHQLQDMTGWRLEYLSSSHTGGVEPTRVLVEFKGHVEGTGYVLVGYDRYISPADAYFGADSTASGGLLAKSGGHVRLVNAGGQIVDQVGWGSAKQIGTWQRLAVLNPGYSAKRLVSTEPGYSVNTPFGAPSLPVTPHGGGLISPEKPSTVTSESTSNNDGAADTEPVCTQAMLSEILPNPAGADGGQEFIELYNPATEAISLLGCGLRLGGEGGKLFALPNVTIPPQGYVAFYDSETKLTLPNASGTEVWLLGTNFEEAIHYADGLSDNQSWANFGGVWQKAAPTPNAANTPLAASKADEDAQTTPVTPAITVCKPGQERNPATNRCRTITATSSTPTACKPGQERNPTTNRCRNIPVTAEVKPCPAGQERNLGTNRCRKISNGANTAVTVTDVETPASTQVSWLVAGTAVASAGGYGVYEWRRDIFGFLSNLKEKLKP